MKKIAIILFLFALPIAARAQLSTCSIAATFYDTEGQPHDSLEIYVQRVVNQSETLFGATPKRYLTDANGQATITVPRSAAGDTVFAYIYANAWGSPWARYGWSGVPVVVPDAPAATLANLAIATTLPITTVVASPITTFYDSTNAAGYRPDTIFLGTGLVLLPKAGGSNDYVLTNTAAASSGDMLKADSNKVTSGGFVTRTLLYDSTGAIRTTLDGHATDIASVTTTANAALPKSDTTALHAQQLANLRDADGGFADGDSISTQIKTVKDIAGGKGDSDSLSTTTATANAALPKADTTALHAQKFAVLNDKDAGYADGDSVSTQISARITTAAASDSLDVALTVGVRAVSSASRIYVSDDSVAAFTGAINIDASTGNIFRGTTSGNTTATITNMVDGQTITVVVTQGASHTFAFANVRWAGGSAPTLTTGANACDIFTIIQAGGIKYGSSVQNLTP